jgi:uncharacterized membrane protein YphA (DoxX/SURF4 family)
MILRLILGGIFLYAGVVKIAAPVAFAGSVAAYKILPYFGNYLVASILPWLELLCGLMLVTGYKYRSAAMLVFILSLVFMGALLSVIFRGLDIDCGCFRQGGGKTSAWTALARDIGCMLVAVYLSRSREGGR